MIYELLQFAASTLRYTLTPTLPKPTTLRSHQPHTVTKQATHKKSESIHDRYYIHTYIPRAADPQLCYLFVASKYFICLYQATTYLFVANN